MTSIDIPANVLLALRNLAARDATGTHGKMLSVIRLDSSPGGTATAAATNGTVIGACRLVCDLPEAVSIPVSAIDALRPGQHESIAVSIATPTITLSRPNGMSIAVDTSDSVPFPDWRRVIPAETNGTPAQFDLGLLRKFEKVAELLASKRGASCSLRVYPNGEGAAIVRVVGVSYFVGAVMPLRDGGTTTTAPDWLS